VDVFRRLAVERRLPFGVMGRIVGQFTRALHELFFVNRNLATPAPSSVDPHGRVMYGSILPNGRPVPALADNGFPADVIELTNQSKVYSYSITSGLEKHFATNVSTQLSLTRSGCALLARRTCGKCEERGIQNPARSSYQQFQRCHQRIMIVPGRHPSCSCIARMIAPMLVSVSEPRAVFPATPLRRLTNAMYASVSFSDLGAYLSIIEASVSPRPASNMNCRHIASFPSVCVPNTANPPLRPAANLEARRFPGLLFRQAQVPP
jgi:hypothetical protein